MTDKMDTGDRPLPDGAHWLVPGWPAAGYTDRQGIRRARCNGAFEHPPHTDSDGPCPGLEPARFADLGIADGRAPAARHAREPRGVAECQKEAPHPPHGRDGEGYFGRCPGVPDDGPVTLAQELDISESARRRQDLLDQFNGPVAHLSGHAVTHDHWHRHPGASGTDAEHCHVHSHGEAPGPLTHAGHHAATSPEAVRDAGIRARRHLPSIPDGSETLTRDELEAALLGLRGIAVSKEGWVEFPDLTADAILRWAQEHRNA